MHDLGVSKQHEHLKVELIKIMVESFKSNKITDIFDKQNSEAKQEM